MPKIVPTPLSHRHVIKFTCNFSLVEFNKLVDKLSMFLNMQTVLCFLGAVNLGVS